MFGCLCVRQIRPPPGGVGFAEQPLINSTPFCVASLVDRL
jgi:hypothetical protein